MTEGFGGIGPCQHPIVAGVSQVKVIRRDAFIEGDRGCGGNSARVDAVGSAVSKVGLASLAHGRGLGRKGRLEYQDAAVPRIAHEQVAGAVQRPDRSRRTGSPR